MGALHGSDGCIKIGATSVSAMLWINQWTLNETIDEAIQKPLSQAYTSRLTGHTDWTATVNSDLDYADTDLVAMLVLGAAVTVYLYTDETTPKGRTGAGKIFAVTYNQPGTDKATVDLDIRGTAALSDIS